MLGSLDSCRDLLSLQSRNLNTSQQCPIQVPSLCPSPPICLYDFTSVFSCAATPLSTGARPTPTNPEASGVFSLRRPAPYVHLCLPVVLTHLHTHLCSREKAPDSLRCVHLVAILKIKSWQAEPDLMFGHLWNNFLSSVWASVSIAARAEIIWLERIIGTCTSTTRNNGCDANRW